MRSTLYLIGALLGLGLGKALGPDLFALATPLLRDPLITVSTILVVSVVYIAIIIHRKD